MQCNQPFSLYIKHLYIFSEKKRLATFVLRECVSFSGIRDGLWCKHLFYVQFSAEMDPALIRLYDASNH